MNKFYHILQPNQPLPNTFVFVNDKKMSYAVMTKNHDFTHYTTKTSDNFDREMAYKIVKFKPPYEAHTLLDYHLNYYLTTSDSNKQLFVKHIEYVIIEILKKIPASDVYITLMQEWIAQHQTYKLLNPKETMNIQTNGSNNNIITDVKDTTITINNDSANNSNIKELQEQIAFLNTQLEFIQLHLTRDDYQTLTDDLTYTNKELAKPNVNVSKIKSILQSIPNLLNAIPSDKIINAIDMIQKVSNLF